MANANELKSQGNINENINIVYPPDWSTNEESSTCDQSHDENEEHEETKKHDEIDEFNIFMLNIYMFNQMFESVGILSKTVESLKCEILSLQKQIKLQSLYSQSQPQTQTQHIHNHHYN